LEALLKFGSVCSGIEAASVAWHPLGWKSEFYSEIEPFPSAVLKHHYPETPNLGDMTKYEQWTDTDIDVLVGGTPCQSFSVAGLRKGLADPRGNLMLTFGAIAAKYRSQWLTWENVFGVLSSNGGRDFASFLGLLSGRKIKPPKNGWKNSGFVPGYKNAYGLAWRVLDAQFFGVAQRRRRVFVVGYLGDWRPPAAVLFERESLRGDSPPSREKGKGSADRVAKCLTGHSGRLDFETEDFITYGIDEECNASSEIFGPLLRGGQGGTRQAVAFNKRPMEMAVTGDIVGTLRATDYKDGQCAWLPDSMQVRRLTPIECERLQGFPDNYTRIPWRKHSLEDCPDGHRYKALGNSMAVPVMNFIGKRIELIESLREGVL
jgi:DNA (cytosine-5)-methyltransferase 1